MMPWRVKIRVFSVQRVLKAFTTHLGPVARSLVSANRWLRGIKIYRFPWYLTLVSTNHASSNPGLTARRSATSKLILSWETLIGDW